MKKILFFFLILIPIIKAQAEIYPVKDFSDDYYATIEINKDSQIEYTVLVFDKKTNVIMIKDHPELLDEPYESNEFSANIAERYYGEFSPIIYDDFNFDGVKDFAIQNGRYGCYGGPSYTVYLAQKEEFETSDEFSELTEGYCGMFGYNPDLKEIYTMTKSGASWHKYETYDVVNNKPRLIQEYIVDGFGTPESVSDYGGVNIIESNFNPETQKMDEREYTAIFDGFIDRLFSFRIAKNNKQVIFFKSPKTEKLTYAFLKDNDEVEVVHDSGDYHRSDFVYKKNGDIEHVYFSNPSVDYDLYKTSNSIGLKVTTNGKTYDFVGDFKSIKGNLADLFL